MLQIKINLPESDAEVLNLNYSLYSLWFFQGVKAPIYTELCYERPWLRYATG